LVKKWFGTSKFKIFFIWLKFQSLYIIIYLFILKKDSNLFLNVSCIFKKNAIGLVKWKCDVLCGTTQSCFHPYLNFLFDYPNPLHLWKYIGYLTKTFTFKISFFIWIIKSFYIYSLLLNFIFIQCRFFIRLFQFYFLLTFIFYLINLYLIQMDSVKLTITFLHMMDKPNNDISLFVVFITLFKALFSWFWTKLLILNFLTLWLGSSFLLNLRQNINIYLLDHLVK
jgi:hypothetical protein